MNTHADTWCVRDNWTPMHYTGDICELSPFLNTYAPVQEIAVALCYTVWKDDEGKQYLIVGDKISWCVTVLENSLINPNQIRGYGL